jgi:hypothetical protein
MFTVYKITNTLNGKTYIGVHKTDNPNDSYMGSGRAIKNAIAKHGRENFTKEVLFEYENADDAYEKEKKLTLDFYLEENYNMKQGGVGGFTKEDSRKGIIALARIGGKASHAQKKGVHSFSSKEHSEHGRKGGLALKNKPKSEAHKQALRDAWARKKHQ